MGMSYLLDTHVLLWLLTAPGRVRDDVSRALGDKRHVVLVSAASAMEVATKTRLGKLPEGSALAVAWSARIAEIGAQELAVTGEHAAAAGSMTWEHRDPFDRLLVAQAQHENLVLVTQDRRILAVPGLRTLTW